MFGRQLDERLGKWHFWLMFAGFNLTFMPQHFLGLLGMPRRIYTYSEGGPWEIYNRISTIGSFVMAVAMLVFAFNVLRSRRYARVGNDPWVGDTLEWFADLASAAWELGRRRCRTCRARVRCATCGCGLEEKRAWLARRAAGCA